MKEIPLTQGLVALVDDEDYDSLVAHKWCAAKDMWNCYAMRRDQGLIVRMHNAILNTSAGQRVDHKDHNGLNNQKYNLRVATNAQNCANQRKGTLREYTSIYKGVYWNKGNKRWRAQINVYGEGVVYLGIFKIEDDAARAYNVAALKYFGDFAYLNEIAS